MKLDVTLNPTLDAARLNALLAELKKSLGALGDTISPIDEDAFKSAFSEVGKSGKENLDKVGKAADDAAKKGSSMLEKFAKFTLVKQVFTDLTSSVNGLASPFVELDTATQNLKTLGAEAAAIAPNLREAAISMSRDLPFAAAELQTTMFDALASGVKGGEEGLKSFADTAAKLATGGGSSIGDATKLLAGQLNAYGKSAEDASKFADIFFNTVNYGVTSVPELSNTLANVIPTAAAAGVELENIGAALAVMTSKGIPTAQSTTKLNQLLLELQKPSATLAPILEKAGVSLESLKQDDLPVTLQKVSKALQETGVAATQAFSSSEAVAGFNVLAGDLEGFAQTFEDVRDTTGSAQFAYEQMSDSIEVRTKQLLSTVNSFVIEGLGFMGTGFVSLAQSAGTVAPIISTLAGIGSIVPDGTIDKVKGLASTIKSGFIPTLASMLSANAAGATSFSVLWASALGPVAAVIGGIAAVVAATKIIADLATETAAEKQEEAKAEQQLLETQRKVVEAKQSNAAATTRQIEQFKELSSNVNRTAAEEERLRSVTEELTKKFPSVNLAAGASAETLAALSQQSAKSSEEILKLGDESLELSKKLAANAKQQITLELAIEKDALEQELGDALDKGFADSLSSGFSKFFSGDLGGIAEIADATLLAGFGNEISEFIFGASFSKTQAENFSKGTTDAISSATSASDITTALAEFTQKITVEGEKLGLSPQEQDAAIKRMQAFAKKREAQLKSYAENDKKLSSDIAANVSKTFDGLTTSGKSAADSIALISSRYELSPLKVAETVLGDELSRIAANGGASAANIEKVAQMTGLSKEQAKKLLETQIQQTKEAEKTAGAVSSIGLSFADAKKAASEQFQESFSASLDLLKKIREANARGDKAEAESLQRQLALVRKKTETQNAELKQLTALEEKERERYNPKKIAEIKSREDEIAKIFAESAKLRRELATGALEDEEEVGRQRLELAAQQLEQQIQKEIEEARKLKVGKDIIASEKIALEGALEEKLRAAKLKNARDLELYQAKLDADSLKASADRLRKQTAERIAEAKIELELLKAEEDSQAGSRLDNLTQQGEARLQILKLQQKQELDEFIATNAAVQKAFDELIRATAAGNADSIREASAAYEKAREDAIGSSEARALFARQEKDRRDTTVKTEREIRAAKIAELAASAQKERDLAIEEARTTLEDRLEIVRGNHAEELAAYNDYLKKKKEADEKYLRESSDEYLVFSEVVQAIQRKLSEGISEEKKQELEDRRAELKREEELLLESLKSREIMYAEYSAKLAELRKKEAQLQEETYGEGFFDKIRTGLVEGLDASARIFGDRARKVGDEYLLLLDNVEATEEEKQKKKSKFLEETAKSSLLTLSKFAIEGELTFSRFASTMLDTAFSLLEKQIPIWVASIFGTTVAELGLGGVLVAAGLTAALYGLVAAAKGTLGRATGEVNLRGAGTTTSDDNLRFLSVSESVVTARGTLARGRHSSNEELLTWINATGRSAEDFYRERGISLGSDASSDDGLSRKLEEVVGVLRSHEERLDKIARYVSRDSFGEKKIRVDLVEDPSASVKAKKRRIDISSSRG